MKKISVLCAICLIALTGFAFGQAHTQSFTFDDLGLGGGAPDSGTYNQNDTFSFDVYLTYAGYSCFGFDLWLETQTLNNFAGSLSITGATWGTAFADPIQSPPRPNPFDVSSNGVSPGYLTHIGDLGATTQNPFAPVPPGTYFVVHVSLAINGAQPGTYILQSTTVGGHRCITSSQDSTGHFVDNPIPAEQYTITIVPEPSTLALLATATIGGGAWLWRRASRKAHSQVN